MSGRPGLGLGLTDRPDTGVVVVTGTDTRAFLQDMVSQDVAGLGPGDGADSLFLQPTGKLGVRFRALVVGLDGEGDGADGGEEWWLVTDEGFGPALAETVSRYLLRVDVEVDDRTAASRMLSLRGDGSAELVGEVAGVPVPGPLHSHVAWGEARVVRSDWPGVPGVDVVGPAAAIDAAAAALRQGGATDSPAADFESLRVESGVPRMGVDLDESVIPQEAGLDATAVSFEKGCFLGQELVCRIHDRGRVNRHLRRLRVVGAEPPAGAVLEAGGKEVGSLTSVAAVQSNGGTFALGFVRHEVEPGAEVGVRWPGGDAVALVEEIPSL